MRMNKETYFRELAAMYTAANQVFGNQDSNELWFDVTDIHGRDLRSVIDRLNEDLKKDGLIHRARIYSMGEGRLWFTPKGLRKIAFIQAGILS